jgi:hypothetical protein
MFMECPRKYYWYQKRGYSPKKRPDYVQLGTYFHKAMEVWARAGQEEARATIKNTLSKQLDETKHIEDFDPHSLEKAEAILLGMVDGFPYPVEPTAIEEKFALDFEGHLLAGRVDGTKTIGGRAMIFDYKTKGSLDDVGDDSLLVRDFQASFYFYSMVLLNRYFEGVEFLYVRRPSLRQRQKEPWWSFCKRIYKDYIDKNRRDFYYARAVTYRDRKDAAWLDNLRQVLKNIEICDNFDIWPMYESACKVWTRCPYMRICNDDSDWKDHYDDIGPDAHPELEED